MATKAQETTGNSRGGGLLDGAQRFARRPGLIARLAAPALNKMLDRIDAGLISGTIHGTLPDGTPRVLGGHAPGFECTFELRSWNALVRIASNGSVGLYQAWEAGEWWSPDPVPLFAMFVQNSAALGDTARAKGPFRHALKWAHLFNRNTPEGAQKNISAHYDLGNDFYEAWLDETMTYSSGRWGVWRGPNPYEQMCDRLANGQLGKIKMIQERLPLHEGAKHLEIGCGWGSAAAIIASRGVDIDAISLSDQQLLWARERLPSRVAGDVQYLKRDFRDCNGQYDGVYSIEMVEAIGRENWPTFMDCVARNLKPGGRAAIQYISYREDLFEKYAASADFIQAYIFPGGLLINTPEFRQLAEERGLSWQDQDDFGLDYAETLKMWRANFDAAVRDGRLPDGFDARFIELWRYYLMYCEGGFRGRGIDVHQVTLVKK